MTDTTTQTPPESSKLPVFYIAPAAVSAERHARAGLRAQRDFAFARTSNAVPLTLSEIAEAAKHFAIAFSAGDQPLPLAVLGLRNDENLFVDAEARWLDEAYVPAYVRRYPFILSNSADSSQLILCIDEGADSFEPESERPFFVDGKPDAALREILRFCETYQAQYEQTVQFGQWLHQEGLLEDRVARAELEDGGVLTLNGFRTLDEARFRTLPDDKLLELHRRGWLPLLHFHVQSLGNFRRLGRLAQQRAPRRAA